MSNTTYQFVSMPTGAASYEAKWGENFNDFRSAAEHYADALAEYRMAETMPVPTRLADCCFADDHVTMWVMRIDTPSNNR